MVNQKNKHTIRAARLIPLFLIVLFLSTCTAYETSVRPKNVSSIYNPSDSNIHPEYFVYHTNDSISQVYFRINTKELQFNAANKEKVMKARFRIRYRLYDTFQSGHITDSATLIYDVPQAVEQGFYMINFPLKMLSGKINSLELTTTDLLNYSGNLAFILLDKRSTSSRQNFLIRDPDGFPVFSPYIYPNKQFLIENIRNSFDSLIIEKYDVSNHAPIPPFSMSKLKNQNITPDTVWTVKYTSKSQFILSDKGVYLIKLDSSLNDGLALFQFGDFYPETKTAQTLLSPLKYLSTNKEFRKLERFHEPKNAVDSFWLAASGSMNRSKELIRVYYSRIFYANVYFGHASEGWLSDRGMIFAVYGPPKTIYKSDNAERWIYGESKNLASMDFYFERKRNPFSDNNFILSRQEVYKSSWYQAVDTWRNGRVYSVMN